MKLYTKILDVLEKVLKGLISIAFAAMLISMVYLVIMRYFFRSAPSWCEEFARFGFVYLVFLACPIGVRRGQHLQVDFISSHYPPMMKYIMSIISNVAGVALLTYLGLLAGKLCLEVTTLSGAMQLPFKYIYSAIPLGCVCMMLFAFEIIIRDIKEIAEITRERRKIT